MKLNAHTKIVLTALALTAIACGKTTKNSAGVSDSVGIIGGQTVAATDPLASSTVALYDMVQGSLCTGTILSDSIIVTAGHCVADSTASALVVMFGGDIRSAGVETRKVTNFTTTAAYMKFRKDAEAADEDPELQKKMAERKALIAADAKIQAKIAQIQELADKNPDLTEDDPRYVVLMNELQALQNTNPALKANADEVRTIVQEISRRISNMKDVGDIAVIQFSGGLPAGYKAAKMLRDAAQLKNGASVVLAGYGITDGKTGVGAGTLRKVTVTLTDAKFSPTEVLFDQTAGKGACHGDSGGPAFITVGGETLVFGVTSRGYGGDDADQCGRSALYTSIPAEIAFIDKAIADFAKPAPFFTVNKLLPQFSRKSSGQN